MLISVYICLFQVVADLAMETAKYVFPKRFGSRNLEEALMSVPDLETAKFKVLSRNDRYEIRELEPFFVAETTMPGKYGFDLNGSGQSFNVLAEYLFGKVSMDAKKILFLMMQQLIGEADPQIETSMEESGLLLLFLGFLLLSVQAHLPQLKPPKCNMLTDGD